VLTSAQQTKSCLSIRAHLNEAPDEPHRRLAAAGLLADDVVFSDPFVTLNRATFWRDYQMQLRAAGEELPECCFVRRHASKHAHE
jgi:hypothetical protein